MATIGNEDLVRVTAELASFDSFVASTPAQTSAPSVNSQALTDEMPVDGASKSRNHDDSQQQNLDSRRARRKLGRIGGTRTKATPRTRT